MSVAELPAADPLACGRAVACQLLTKQRRLLDGAGKVLELIGTTTLADSLRCAREPGVVCMMGMVGDKRSLDNFSPMEVIPTAICLTTYDRGAADFMRTPLHQLVEKVEAGALRVHVGKVFHLDQIAEAHRCMEENKAGGKIVRAATAW